MALELEKHLVLNKYFFNLFGFSDFDELREKLRDTEEGYDSTGRSYFISVLIGLKPKWKEQHWEEQQWEEQLLRYDEAIRVYVEKLRHNRGQPNFNLKYFQYLAVLFAEVFLDRYYNDRESFINKLNEFLRNFNEENGTQISSFTEEDLKKLAFWMATGSGKTIIMHINYWQILKYSGSSWDNIILITPNEGLSKQHEKELKLSGIPCKLYEGNIDNLKTKDKEILVIDIHKLTKEKKGEGVSIDISYFDGKNLVFIDEGHKGQKSEEQKWKRLREEIGENGFLLEYSATFGQVIGKNKDLLEEYAKAIIFDYSYKYFYTDGYGKDFYVYSIREDVYTKAQRDLLLTTGLLSFYEQLVIFEKHKEELWEYNIEKPLLIFVGGKVTGKGINSDVVRIIQFLDKIIKDENYLKENVGKILEGKSGLIDERGNDIFKGKFEYIKKYNVEEIVEGIYQKIFGGKGRLKLYEIKNAEGEIGLKTNTGEKYFGVINVGNTKSLKDLIKVTNIEIKEDHFAQSLFLGIDENNSPINVLIGSKKFIEGWNSWRVSNMGLMNMGKSEGPQIIQLFGRGVRLKGKNYSLKREDTSDYKLKALQTLFIFGLNADYVNAFLSTIEKEEVDYEEISIPIKFNMPEKWEGKIYTIKTKEDFDFVDHIIELTFDEDTLKRVKLDLRPKIKIAHGLEVEKADIYIEKPIEIPENLFEIIDWNFIYSEITNYKIAKGYYNLVIDRKILKEILMSRKYQIFMHETKGIEIEQNGSKAIMKIKSFEGIIKLQEILLNILKNYISKFYKKEEKKKMMNYLEAEPLTRKNESMFPENKEIILKIPKYLIKDFEKLIKQIKEYNDDKSKLPDVLQTDIENIPTICFDKHLYVPLVAYKKGKEDIKSIPVKLNKGETDFVKDLRTFLEKNKNLFKDRDVFLLRNLSKKGVGFFINVGFYPDFIIWIKEKDKQNIIFVDPKGIRNLADFDDDKIQFCVSYVKEIENVINGDLKSKNEEIDLYLDAFIISVSKYEDIKEFWKGVEKEDFERNHIIFQEDKEYIKRIFEFIS